VRGLSALRDEKMEERVTDDSSEESVSVVFGRGRNLPETERSGYGGWARFRVLSSVAGGTDCRYAPLFFSVSGLLLGVFLVKKPRCCHQMEM
jgi:hypothetical protein